MSKIFDLFKRGSFYTVVFSLLLYLGGYINTTGTPSMPWHRFLLVLAFGMIISFGEWLDDLLSTKLYLIFRLMINYALVMAGFIFVFIALERGDSPAKIFAAVAIFTVIYSVFALAKYLIDRLVFKKVPLAPAKKTPLKPEYRPLYSDED